MYDIPLEWLLKIAKNKLQISNCSQVMPTLANKHFCDVIEKLLTSAKNHDVTVLQMSENEGLYVG